MSLNASLHRNTSVLLFSHKHTHTHSPDATNTTHVDSSAIKKVPPSHFTWCQLTESGPSSELKLNKGEHSPLKHEVSPPDFLSSVEFFHQDEKRREEKRREEKRREEKCGAAVMICTTLFFCVFINKSCFYTV